MCPAKAQRVRRLKSYPGTVAPPGITWSGAGGDKCIEALQEKAPYGGQRSCRPERVANTEQAPKRPCGSRPAVTTGKAAGVGIVSIRNQRCRRGIGASMHERLDVEQGKPDWVLEKERLIREDRSRPNQVADGPVLALKQL